jgi:hypothetical protein
LKRAQLASVGDSAAGSDSEVRRPAQPGRVAAAVGSGDSDAAAAPGPPAGLRVGPGAAFKLPVSHVGPATGSYADLAVFKLQARAQA